jgi:hypothetical protein
MRRFVFFSFSFVLVAIFLGQAAAQTGSKALVFSHVTVIDGTGS